MADRIIYDYSKLKGKIREKDLTMRQFSKGIGVSMTTLYTRLNNSTYFSTSEIENAMNLLDLSFDDVNDIFFTHQIRQTE